MATEESAEDMVAVINATELTDDCKVREFGKHRAPAYAFDAGETVIFLSRSLVEECGEEEPLKEICVVQDRLCGRCGTLKDEVREVEVRGCR